MRYVQQRWAKQGRLTSPGSRQVQLRLSLSNKGSYGHTMLYLAVTYLCTLRLRMLAGTLWGIWLHEPWLSLVFLCQSCCWFSMLGEAEVTLCR